MLYLLFQLPLVAAQAAVSIEVDVHNVTNDHVSRRWMGCHSDYGFAQTPRGFLANLVYNPSFANYGSAHERDAVVNSAVMGVSDWFTDSTAGAASPRPELASGSSCGTRPSVGIRSVGAGDVSVINRGIAGAGFAIEAGKPYDVELYIWQSAAVTVFVELVDRDNNATIASHELAITPTGPGWGATWALFNFSVTPSRGTGCTAIPFGSDPTIDCGGGAGAAAHVCQRCGAELRVGVRSKPAGAINVGYVSLMPGRWGRLTDKRGSLLPVLKSGADVLTQMGITVMRSGGSVSQSVRWKDWRGPFWNRASSQQVWGKSFLAGWGPFEVIDMCNALDIEPIVTLAYDANDAMDWADLVEYTWGNANTTTWGRRRAADGHPAVYNVTTFELGNEQYNPDFIAQVSAMEARAVEIGGVPPLRYMFPDNNGLNGADQAAAIAAKLPIERIMPDVHVGAGGAVKAAAQLFGQSPDFPMSAVNCETNAGSHDLRRGLDEAADLLDWFTADPRTTDRLYARTASFCSGSSSQWDTWDQAISFFLPNMTWLQPPGYVHKIIMDSWVSTVLGTSSPINGSELSFAAMRDGGGGDGGGSSRMVLRLVNHVAHTQTVTVRLTAKAAAGAEGAEGSEGEFKHRASGRTAKVLTLQDSVAGAGGHGDNSPASPDRIAPVTSTVPVSGDGATVVLELPPYSFVNAVLQ